MKTVKIIIIAILAIIFTSNAFSQSATTKFETIKVSGNCDMCKARIEKAAKIDGVTKAEWSKKDKTLTATFDPAKTSIDAIGKKIAIAGHDNEKAKATDAVYDKLPGCCQYR
ncbi:MAG: heavy-metal-associated domain-containing protein [Bacteroidota bacterium]|nr:heavy-metal-associated domain-containing protein [Bacteroidota bacterium]